MAECYSKYSFSLQYIVTPCSFARGSAASLFCSPASLLSLVAHRSPSVGSTRRPFWPRLHASLCVASCPRGRGPPGTFAPIRSIFSGARPPPHQTPLPSLPRFPRPAACFRPTSLSPPPCRRPQSSRRPRARPVQPRVVRPNAP